MLLDEAEERLDRDDRRDEADDESHREQPQAAAQARRDFLTSSSPLAATIVGTASMNENSTIVRLLMPISEPPTIVAAERETPGTMAIA